MCLSEHRRKKETKKDRKKICGAVNLFLKCCSVHIFVYLFKAWIFLFVFRSSLFFIPFFSFPGNRFTLYFCSLRSYTLGNSLLFFDVDFPNIVLFCIYFKALLSCLLSFINIFFIYFNYQIR